MESFWISTGLVALAEMGDKTQLLALILASRFKKPIPIIVGILVATLLNHGLAGALGAWITANIDPHWLRWGLGVCFIAMGFWALVPDKFNSGQTSLKGHWGVFGATFVLFFIAEMGDKTQLATVALAAHYPNAIAVVLGTTLGMLIANVPAVLLGDKILSRMPMNRLRWAAATLFVGLGVWTFFQ
ncbi:MAG: TMEM165/GDT1 family protein [Burkholderiaceae bacterium]|nr:TMEM165/GDT1 family protein [Burkholderiaceae bacterium]